MNQKVVEQIKLWSVVVGVLSLSSLLTLSVYPILSAVGIISVIAILLGLAVLYAGVKITSMDVKTVGMIFWAKFIWLVVNFLFSLEPRAFNVIRFAIILAQGIIVWYLIVSLKKLHAPVASK
jgi:hypothetical protein